MKKKYKKYYMIYSESSKLYWNRVSKKFDILENATEYEGTTIDGIERIIEADSDILKCEHPYISIKTIFKL